jgi:hypothetical protein
MSHEHDSRPTNPSPPMDEDNFPLRDRDTQPPAEDLQEPADLLASVALQLDGVSRQLASVARDLTFAIGQGKSQGKTLGEHDRRITALEGSVRELRQLVAPLMSDGK